MPESAKRKAIRRARVFKLVEENLFIFAPRVKRREYLNLGKAQIAISLCWKMLIPGS
jgi:hypothetical protein